MFSKFRDGALEKRITTWNKRNTIERVVLLVVLLITSSKIRSILIKPYMIHWVQVHIK
jgi:hypothetical protein